ncbi:MAG: hypothetical protein AB1632_11475 [Nitrospirota bacterium]
MIENKINVKSILGFLIIFYLAFIHTGILSAGTVVVKPGQFDHFTLQMPDKIIAGENFVIKAEVYDSNNNLITNFSESGKVFRIDVTGSATVQPSTLSAASFSGGSANISINSKKAEKITFSIRESNGTVPVISKDLTVSPNKLDHFILQTPGNVIAGSKFDVRVIAKDLFDNTVDDLDIGRNIKITSKGTSSIKMLGSSAVDFRNGLATASFVSEKTGDVIIELQEITTGSMGRTQSIAVNPSSLSYFKLQAPKNASAGEEFDLLVAAYDAYDNLVTNYSSAGNGVALYTSGSSKIEPSFISPSGFKDGQTVIKAVYEKAEEIQVIAKERNREQTGKTSEILVSNTAPDHFVVVTPDIAVSGQRFKIKVEAYDRFNNIVKNYNLIGNDVILNTSGSGSLTPSMVPPSAFTNGIAMVDVIYDKAESFLISAKMTSDKAQGRITLKDVEKGKEIPQAKPAKKETERTIQKKKADAAESAQAKTEVGKELKPKVKEAPPKKAETAKREIEKKPAQRSLKEPEKKGVEPKPATQITEAPKKPVEIAKTEEKRLKPSEPFSVSNISIIEAKNKAMLVINITNPNGHLDYTDEIESKYGKEWLRLRIKPAVNKTEKTFNFQSAFVGEVRIEEEKDSQNVLDIYMELIPSGVTFDIARIKNTLIVTLANP